MQDQRSQTRKTVSWRVAIIALGSNQAIPARVSEVTLSGACLFCPTPLKVGAEYRVVLAVPDTSRTRHNYVEARSTVVYSTLVGSANEYRTGVKFLDLSAPHRKILESEL